jgi:hypothetical protein
MTTDAPACPPVPSALAHADLLTVAVEPDTALYRIFRGSDPAHFSRARGANRFDPLPDPWQATQVLYAGSTPEVAISETVLRWHDSFAPGASLILERSKIQGRQLIQLRPRNALTVVDLTGFGLARIASLTAPAAPDQLFLANRAHYGNTQAWGAWLRSQLPHAAGFRWMSRQHNTGFCYVFFEDVVPANTFEPAHAAEALDNPRSSAHELLLQCLTSLGWELDG